METNSLFRFVTVRTPQLIKKKNKKTGFIFYEDIVGDRFFNDFVINPLSKPSLQIKNVIEAAQAYSNPFNSEQSIIEKVGL